jgi:hypothetical protein
LDIHDERIYELMTHFDIFISIYFIFLSNKFVKYEEGKSPFDLLGIESSDFITMAREVSVQIYENETN